MVLLRPLWWRCIECVIHHEQDVCEEQQYIYVARTSNGVMWCGIEMSLAENFCPLPAPRQNFLSSVHTASTFVVHFPVRDRTAPHHPTLFEF